MSEQIKNNLPLPNEGANVVKKLIGFTSGSRTKEAQVRLLKGGLVMIVDLLRVMESDSDTDSFLTLVLDEIKSGGKPISTIEKLNEGWVEL